MYKIGECYAATFVIEQISSILCKIIFYCSQDNPVLSIITSSCSVTGINHEDYAGGQVDRYRRFGIARRPYRQV